MAATANGGGRRVRHTGGRLSGRKNSNNDLKAHIELMLAEFARFSRLLDDPQDADDNGKTICENALITT